MTIIVALQRAVPTFLLSAGLLLSGCTASGEGGGPITAGARPDGEARFAWTTKGGDSAQLTAVLPDGEHFRGIANALSTRSQPGAVFVTGSGKRDTSVILPTEGKSWTGDIAATLIGDRGRSMQCALRERRAGMGFEGGASGTCKISDGREIAVLF